MTAPAQGSREWKQPAFGEMHTRPSPSLHSLPSSWVAREGAGDYRRPVAMVSGKGTIADIPADHRSRIVPRKYVARRNGLPEDRAYSWRQGIGPGAVRRAGWAARVAARNLDMAAIAAADAEMDGRKRRGRIVTK